MFLIAWLPSHLMEPSIKKLKISDAEQTSCASTRYLNLPLAVEITNKSWLSRSIRIWCYPLVKSIAAKYLAPASMCLNNWFELLMGHTSLLIFLLSFLKSATIRTPVPSILGTGKAFEDHSLGSVPHGVMCPASNLLLISLSNISLRWYGVSYGL